MKFLAEYLLDGDMRLAEGVVGLRLAHPDRTFEVQLSDFTADEHDSNAVLIAHLLFEAPAIEAATSLAKIQIGDVLNALSVTTGRFFKVNRLRLILEWAPGIAMRNMHALIQRPLWESAEQALDDKFMETAATFLGGLDGEREKVALRWYRLALGATTPEEQFSYLWFALEIIAELGKSRTKIPSACPHCRTPLFCESCQTHPVHRPYSGQAIQALVEQLSPPGVDVFAALQKVRHTLMHGDKIEVALEGTDLTDLEVNNHLHWFTRQALISRTRINKDTDFHLGFVDDIRRRNLVLTAHVQVGMAHPDDPQIANIPRIKIDFVEGEKPPSPMPS